MKAGRTGRGTQGPQRRTQCTHTPSGTVAWPPDATRTDSPKASVYSCNTEDCIRDAAQWVRECTGYLGVYRAFTLSAAHPICGELEPITQTARCLRRPHGTGLHTPDGLDDWANSEERLDEESRHAG